MWPPRSFVNSDFPGLVGAAYLSPYSVPHHAGVWRKVIRHLRCCASYYLRNTLGASFKNLSIPVRALISLYNSISQS